MSIRGHFSTTLGGLSAAARALACVALAASVAQAGIVRVGNASGEQPSIAAAVAVASDGDLVLVRSGTYGPFTLDHKGLAIVADEGAAVVVFGTVRVKNLAAGQTARLVGLAVAAVGNDALVATDLQGALRVEESTFSAYATSPSSLVHGATIANADDVVLARVTLRGGSASAPLAAAGDGARVANSRVTLLDVDASGAAGAHGDGSLAASGAAGGVGLRALGSEIYASSSTFVGGDGGRGGVLSTALAGCSGEVPLAGGNGGDGLVVAGASVVRVRASDARGGRGGIGGVNACGTFAAPGADGLAQVGAATALAGSARSIAAPRVVRAGTSATLTFTGAPGDRVVVFVTHAPAHAWHPVFGADVLVAQPIVRRLGAGVVPASGVLTTPIGVAPLPTGQSVSTRHLQIWVLDASGGAHLGGATVLTVIDAAG